jgi:hypothetical protein
MPLLLPPPLPPPPLLLLLLLPLADHSPTNRSTRPFAAHPLVVTIGGYVLGGSGLPRWAFLRRKYREPVLPGSPCQMPYRSSE